MTTLYLTALASLLVVVILLIVVSSQRNQRRIQRLKEELEQLNAKYTGELVESESIRGTLESSIQKLKEELGQLNAKYTGELVESESIRGTLESSIQKLKEELGQLNAKYTGELVESESIRGTLESSIQKLKEELGQLNAKYTGELVESESIRGTLESSIQKLKEELGQLNAKYKDLTDLEKAKSLLGDELNQLKISRDQIFSDNDSALKKLNDEYISAKTIFDSLNTEIQKLEENLEVSSFGLYKPHYDYDTPESYKIELDKIVEQAKEVIKSNSAIVCGTEWEVNGSKVEGRKMTRHYSKIMLRAFNGECDSAVLKVRWNNISNMEERILKAYSAINKLGETHNISITDEYLQLKMQELRLTYEYQEKRHDEKEEQRRIREQLREEEKSIREIEQARLEAEKEEVRYTKALQKAREELSGATDKEIDGLKQKICDLEIHLKNAQELKERAISMAQITKAGHVYVISNIGSFGDNVYKIGMTRRMEPSDRVRELSGASVPFGFDIHAMIYSENAPELENKFHKKFAYNRLNLINNRKEFFNVTLNDLEEFARDNGYVIEFMKIAEARDYRQTCSIRNVKSKEEIEAEMSQVFPENLIDIDGEDDALINDAPRFDIRKTT